MEALNKSSSKKTSFLGKRLEYMGFFRKNNLKSEVPYLSRSEETKKININYLTLHFFAAKCAYEDNDITAALRHLKTAADCSIAIDKAENLPLEVLSSNNAIRQHLHTIPGFALTQEEVLAHSLSYSILHGFFETNLFAQRKEDADYLEIIRRLKQYARLPAFSVS